jgi:hypothetical protein
MCPLGDERPEAVREIGRAYVANVGGDPRRGSYAVAVCRRGSTAVPSPIDSNGPEPTRHGAVKGYPRLAYNQWRLQIRALLACFPEERAAASRSTPYDHEDDPTDEQALMLGRELCAGNERDRFDEEFRQIGRKAWARGARPSEH